MNRCEHGSTETLCTKCIGRHLGIKTSETIERMVTLERLFDACGECRLEVGGKRKYKILTEYEIREVINAFECMRKLAAITRWLETNQPDVFRRGIWEESP